jgi:fumarate hydratase, class II
MSFRTESDALGEVKIPEDKYYGASTQRAVANFPVSDLRFNREFICALGRIKQSAAEVNSELGRLDKKLAQSIVEISQSIIEGKADEHFVVDVFQTGSGTSTNMNANEVIANLCNEKLIKKLGTKEPIHPNDHVNLGQSSNDVIPTAIHVSLSTAIQKSLLPALSVLSKTLHSKAEEFSKIYKMGRTHLQDATPITLGQEFSGYHQQMLNCSEDLNYALARLSELPIGGTAVGTGINTHPKFGSLMSQKLSEKTGLKFREARNHFEAQASKDACVSTSGALKTCAVALTKIANDIRWLASGPRCGFYEIKIPSLQPGSSIMPGKVNPVIPEMVLQVCAQVIGNDATISWAGASGNFQLNVMMPVMAYNLHQSVALLSSASTLFAQLCINGITANKERCEDLMEQSLSMVTPLANLIGYDKASELAKEAYASGQNIRDLLLAKKILPENKINEVLNPEKMIKPQ